MSKFRSFAALAALALSVIFAVPALADFPKELKDKHPCFKEIASPWDDPISVSKMPEAYKNWDTVYVGWWNEFDGSTKVCTAFLLSSVKANGDVSATYATAYPYKGEWQMNGSIKVEGGKQTLLISNTRTSFSYVMNEDGSLEVTSGQTGKKGTLYPANRVAGSVGAGAINK